MLKVPEIFNRYEKVKSRLPQAKCLNRIRDIEDLMDISKQIDVFVFDAFGVLNVGDALIEGSDLRLRELRSLGCKIRIFTYAASHECSETVAKFLKLGIEIEADEIITSRDAALSALTPDYWGVIAAREDKLTDLNVDHLRLAHRVQDFDCVEGFLFLSSSGWTNVGQKLLERSLKKRDRPVFVANPDLVAPRDYGFSIEPGYFGHLLADIGIKNVRFFGKPFPEVYDLVEASLPDIATNKIAMCGDTLHTDILGAMARGWQTVLVTQDGLFSGYETDKFCSVSGIYPDWRLARI